MKSIQEIHEEEQEEARERDRTHRAIAWYLIFAVVWSGLTALWAAKCNQACLAQLGRESGLTVEVAAAVGFVLGLTVFGWVAPEAASRVNMRVVQWVAKRR